MEQIAHELQSHRHSIEKLRKDISTLQGMRYYSAALPARLKIRQLTIPFAQEIVRKLEESKGKQSGRATYTNYRDHMQALVDVVEPEVIALITLKSLFDIAGSFTRIPLVEAAAWLGNRLADECRFRYYMETGSPQLKATIRKRLADPDKNERYRSYGTAFIGKVVSEIEGKEPFQQWSQPLKCGLSFFLFEIAKEAGIITTSTPWVAPCRQKKFLELSQDYLEQQQEILGRIENLTFSAWPLIEPPIPWQALPVPSKDNFSGGYHTELLRHQLPLCRGHIYGSHFGEKTIELVNTLGATAWQVDPAVYQTGQFLYDKRIEVGALKVPLDPDTFVEAMPEAIVALPTDHPLRRQWRKDQAVLHQIQAKSIKKSIRSRECLAMARDYLDRERFWLSWSCDYRGRTYSQQPWLQPQTSDFEKSTIRFAESQPLTSPGLRWVEIALGGAFIGTKTSFTERRYWLQEHRELIAAVANDPVSSRQLWGSCDSPWSFLQLAAEYHAVVIEQSKQGWQVPLRVDATSSGLQLLSGCLRDPVGLAYSNVILDVDTTASDDLRPMDSYQAVIDLARQKAEANPAHKHLAPFLTDRKLGKASMMLGIYGGSHGTRVKAMVEVLAAKNLYPDPVSWESVNTLATIIHRATLEIFGDAYGALRWLRTLARKALKAGKESFSWKTAAGDLISFRELNSKTITVNTSHLGSLTVANDFLPGVNESRMVKALAPSFVHSLDACILRLALEGWNRPASCIHDALAVLPNDIDELQQRLHKAYVETVSGDPLARLADDLGVSSDELKRLPQGGAALDADNLSPYMFN